jgi:hypothetical protein
MRATPTTDTGRDHVLQVVIDRLDGPYVTVGCPYEDQDWSAEPFEARPDCRQWRDADDSPILAWDSCRLAETDWTDAEYTRYHMTGNLTVPVVPIRYAWSEIGIEITPVVTD